MKDVCLDSCAFDPKYSPEDQAALKIFKLKDEGIIDVMIAHSTEKEIEHPKTPVWVKQKALEFIYSVEVGLTPDEKTRLQCIERTLANQGKIEYIRSDAKHIFEAEKYMTDFITTDKGILKKRINLKQICGLHIHIYTPSEFVALLDKSRT